jgi:hypothetical protein
VGPPTAGESSILLPGSAARNDRGETETLADAVGVFRKPGTEPAVAFLLDPFNLKAKLADAEPQQEVLDKPLQALRRPGVEDPFRVRGDHQMLVQGDLELAAVAGVPLTVTEATRGGPPKGEMRLEETPGKEVFVGLRPSNVELGEGITIRRLGMPAGEVGVGTALLRV